MSSLPRLPTGMENESSFVEDETINDAEESFQWTATTIFQSIVIFILAGLAEIGGGWLVWAAVRGDSSTTGRKPWWFAIIGSLVLILYGFIPCLQPTDSFGRIYAAYGGFFIVLSFLFGWALDGDKPDKGDIVGGSIALLGVVIVMFWPRSMAFLCGPTWYCMPSEVAGAQWAVIIELFAGFR